MKAYMLDEPGKLRLGEAEVPRIGPGQVLLRSRRVGVCVSDVYYYRGMARPPRWPVTPGHELLGEVVESRHPEVRVGDRMVYWGQTEFDGLAEYRAIKPILPHIPDDAPWRDHRGFYDASGAAAVVLDPRLPSDIATMLEPMCSVLRTLLAIPPKPGDSALVVGAGPIGLITLQILKQHQACRSVTVIEKDPVRLEVARRLGADHVFRGHADKEALEQLVIDSDGSHVQYVFDTLSYVEDEVRALSMGLLCPGGTYIIFGSTERPQAIDTWPILSKGLAMRSVPFDVRGYPMHHSACAMALGQRLLLHGLVSVSELISRTIDFEDVEAVRSSFEHYGRGGALKTVVRLP
ncbi:zinc-binding dehydrogenase [Archangium violaceum]|uniref:zinc-dependent alcohol dehydrogenase n=1 Tax=Archangium violaceum TaxID=83451 RepID=UPI00193BBED6|nr:zinc-binding dehydrogenase [Archangium violaceum]QRK10079.1 zinc-binding dehydrogenase [Archangium violaceum]